jgi:hypothetical protein
MLETVESPNDKGHPGLGWPFCYTLDSLHPHRLRCDECGHHVGPVDLVGLDPSNLVSLSDDQAAHYWPALAVDLGLHDYACPVGSAPTLGECEEYAASAGW